MYEYKKKRTYLDLFLDNSFPKKREPYFETEQENAIIQYNKSTDPREKNRLFTEVIDICFKKTVAGVLEMPKFRHLPTALNKEELIEDTYFRLIDKIYMFKEGKISKKTGLPVKAFSYFSTMAKNYILEQILKHNSAIANKADIETSIDLTNLSEDTLNKLTKNNVLNEVELGDYITNFLLSKSFVLVIVKELIIEEESKEKRDEDFIKLGYCLKYLLEKWEKYEFEKKNEFMRILTLYTGFNQQKVSFLFKTFKVEVLKKIDPNIINNKKPKKIIKDDEEEYEDIEKPKKKNEKLTEEEKLMNYVVNSLDDFEAQESKIENIKKREQWKQQRKSKQPKKN